MIRAVEGLVAELRRIGVPISVSESIDAVDGLQHVDLADRGAVKAALGCALVKSSDHDGAFDAVFDIYFSLTSAPDAVGAEEGEGSPEGGRAGAGAGAGGSLDDVDDAMLKELVLRALRRDDEPLRRQLSRLLVTRHAGFTPGRAVAGTYYLYRTMKAVDPDALRLALLAEERASAGPLGDVAQRLLSEDVDRRIRGLEHDVEAEIRRRLVADRGADAVARTLRTPLPEDIDFLTASAAQVSAIRQVVRPMARKLASRLAQKRRRHRRGGLDFRRTVRRSLSTGGTPVLMVFRRPRPSKPQLVVLADISGSVATFAAFTLQLTFALRSEFSKVRVFVFVDGLDEVTRILEESEDVAAATSRINSEGHGVWLDGRSDYGNAFETFWQEHGRQLSHRTTVLVLGDARSNYHAPRREALRHVQERVREVFWLNPEPEAAWNSGDSVIGQYAPYCDAVIECRTVRQLREFVEQLE
ncbi:MAG: domain containing CoxE-like protein [Frankiales bacterium]|nr:domain containing CoxE-like protein [Frankiales bacterium]